MRADQFRVSADQILKNLHGIIRTQHILAKRSTKWWNITTRTVGIADLLEVVQGLAERERTGGCVEILK
jgi:hypothetical protein